MKNPLGIVLTGGGARGAYQAGVLKRIGEIERVRTHGNPFPIIGGSSAGAINGAALAAGSSDMAAATGVIAKLWSKLKPTDVFRCDLLSQAHNSITWILDLSFGGVLGGGHAQSLLDAGPLRTYLKKQIPFNLIGPNVAKGNLYALAVSATNYSSGRSYTFIQGESGHAMWNKSRRLTVSSDITVDHVCASAAIPLVFRPVLLKTSLGTAYFGDGCLRLQQPLSPVIRLGAAKILAIGVRCENLEHKEDATDPVEPSIAEIMGVLFNVMFLDHLAADIEHLERLNALLSNGEICQSGAGADKMRPLKSLFVAPSVNLSQLAADHQRDMPYLIQYFVNSLGRESSSCADLMSYLLFTSKYTSALVDIGYHDADDRIDEIEDFLYGSDNGSQRNARTAASSAEINGRRRPPLPASTAEPTRRPSAQE